MSENLGENNGAEENEREDNALARQRREIMGQLFDDRGSSKEVVIELMHRFKPFFESDLLDGEKFKEDLEACAKVEDKEVFIEQALIAMQPLFNMRGEDYDRLREQEPSREKRTNVNEVLAYDVKGDSLAIHVRRADHLGAGQLRKQFLLGLHEVAKIVKDNENIMQINATSWIVSKNPKLVEKMGFAITGNIMPRTENNEYPGAESVMSREEFLRRYLSEE